MPARLLAPSQARRGFIQADEADKIIEEAEKSMGHDHNDRARDLLAPLVSQNNPRAEVDLATIFRFGHKGLQIPGRLSTGYEDVTKDDVTAAALFRKAAEQGDFSGELNLAGMYEDGEGGLPKDYRQAAFWYLRAAKQNDPNAAMAQVLLGKIYEKGGYGVAQDYVQAYKWYGIGAAHTSFDMNKGCSSADPSDLACTGAVYRAFLAEKMTQAQIMEAERLSHEWKPFPPHQ